MSTDHAINFDLVKCVTKEINIRSYLNYNGKVEGWLSPKSYRNPVKYIFMEYLRDTEAS